MVQCRGRERGPLPAPRDWLLPESQQTSRQAKCGMTSETNGFLAVSASFQRSTVISRPAGEPVRLIAHRFQNPCDGMRNARLKREDAFSHAMIIVSSAMVSSS